MPLYEYECAQCGVFEEMRALTLAAEPCDCISCGTPAPRRLSIPQYASMSASRRVAHETNERSSHEPRRSVSKSAAKGKKPHKPGCACCGGASKGRSSATYLPDGSKMFATKRSWMISH